MCRARAGKGKSGPSGGEFPARHEFDLANLRAPAHFAAQQEAFGTDEGMIRSFVFSQGKLVGQDLGMDFLKVMLVDEDAQIWVDLEQPAPEEARGLLEGIFNFHPLAIEDCVSPSEQPKVDEYDHYLFMVIHAVDYSHAQHQFETTELNLFIGKNFLVTYHEKPLRSVQSTIDRVLKNSAAVARAPDRLTYTLLDFLLDNYDPALDELSAEFAALDDLMLKSSGADVLGQIVALKNEVRRVRVIISPQRDVIARIARGEFKIIRAHLLPYYRDLLDRLNRIHDLAENYRDSLTETLQVHLNLQQMQINRVIKVLTVLATLSLPLVAITSFYGMNVHHFPNMDWTWPQAYGWILGLNAVITALIYILLKRKNWL